MDLITPDQQLVRFSFLLAIVGLILLAAGWFRFAF